MLWHYAHGKPPEHITVEADVAATATQVDLIDLEERLKGMSTAAIEADRVVLRRVLGIGR